MLRILRPAARWRTVEGVPIPVARVSRWAAAVVLLAGRVSAAELAAGDAASAPVVHYREGLLSASIQGLPLDDVLRAVSAETGLRFGGAPLDERDVFKRFSDVPLAEALRRLIGRQNFTLVYGADGEPKRVKLLGGPLPAVAPGSKTPLAEPFQVLLVRQPPVAVSDSLARALRAGQGPLALTRVLQALRSDDAAIRGEVVAIFLRALQSRPELLRSFLALDDRKVATLARSWGGAHAADALALVAARAGHLGVRGLATKGLVRLRSDQPPRS